MERCSLKFIVPPAVQTSHTIAGTMNTIEVRRMNITFRLGPHQQPLKHRHPLSTHLATWNIPNDSTFESEEFHCPRGSYQTFKVSCLGSGCQIDFRQRPEQRGVGTWTLSGVSLHSS